MELIFDDVYCTLVIHALRKLMPLIVTTNPRWRRRSSKP